MTMVLIKVEADGLPPYYCESAADAAHFVQTEVGYLPFVDATGRAGDYKVVITAVNMTAEEVASLPEWNA
jgi:hypothetical protein